MASRIGVVYYLPPLPEGTSILGEGIARVVGSVLESVARAGERPTLVIHGWSRVPVEGLLADFGLDTRSVRLIEQKVPLWFRLWTRYSRRAPHRPARLKRWAAGIALALAVVDLVLVILVSAEVRTVLLVVSAVGAVAAMLTYRKRAGLRSLASRAAASVIARLHVSGLTTRLTLRERGKVVRTANASDVEAWWVPSLSLPEAVSLAAPWMLTCPDIVPIEFPSQWIDAPGVVELLDNAERLVRNAALVTCYSDYTRQHHVIDRLHGRPERTVVIGHGRNDLAEAADLRLDDRAALARDLVDFLEANGADERIVGYDWAGSPFVLAPTQNRPYKNLLTLIRCMHEIEQHRGGGVRLVLTASSLGDSGHGVDLQQLVSDLGLDHVVLRVPKLSSNALARMYALASVAISSSLFEASLPFILAEASSVATPALLADIPVTRQAITDATLRGRMTFEPTDHLELADRIADAIAHRDEFVRFQRSLVGSIYAGRSWSEVGSRYRDALDSIVTGKNGG